MSNIQDGFALFQKILATPGDDAPRLILADWFDENDHHDLATIFRAATNERAFRLRLARLRSATIALQAYLRANVAIEANYTNKGCPLYYATRIVNRELREELGPIKS